MTDYRMMYDSDYLYAFHLMGKPATVKIIKVEGGEIKGEGGRKTRKPIIHFDGKEKPLAINKTNGKAISTLYGPDTKDWLGQWITIYPTKTTFGGEERDCIRVKPERPKVPNGTSATREPGVD